MSSETQAILNIDKSFTSYRPIPMCTHLSQTPITTPGWSRLSQVYERNRASITPFLRACWPSPLTQPGDSMIEQDVSVIIRIIKGTPVGKLFANELYVRGSFYPKMTCTHSPTYTCKLMLMQRHAKCGYLISKMIHIKQKCNKKRMLCKDFRRHLKHSSACADKRL